MEVEGAKLFGRTQISFAAGDPEHELGAGSECAAGLCSDRRLPR
jgi:hypothetical protein